VIVWLWDAPGAACSACGISTDFAMAQEAVQACLAGGQANTALVEEAWLVTGTEVLDPYYQRLGRRWQARRSRDGTIRWHPAAELIAS
jgi:hypothetical protein